MVLIKTCFFEAKTKNQKIFLDKIGNGNLVKLLAFIEATENAIGKITHKQMLPMQTRDAEKTWPDTIDLENDNHYKPNKEVNVGIKRFVELYKGYYT